MQQHRGVSLGAHRIGLEGLSCFPCWQQSVDNSRQLHCNASASGSPSCFSQSTKCSVAQLLNCSVHQFVSWPIGIDALLDTLWCLICCHGNFATIRTGPHSSNGHVGNLSRCFSASVAVDFVSGFVMRIFHYGQMSLSQPFCVIIRFFVPQKYFTTLLAFPVING